MVPRLSPRPGMRCWRGSILMFLVEVYPERVEELSIAQIKYEYYEYSDILKGARLLD